MHKFHIIVMAMALCIISVSSAIAETKLTEQEKKIFELSNGLRNYFNEDYIFKSWSSEEFIFMLVYAYPMIDIFKKTGEEERLNKRFFKILKNLEKEVDVIRSSVEQLCSNLDQSNTYHDWHKIIGEKNHFVRYVFFRTIASQEKKGPSVHGMKATFIANFLHYNILALQTFEKNSNILPDHL